MDNGGVKLIIYPNTSLSVLIKPVAQEVQPASFELSKGIFMLVWPVESHSERSLSSTLGMSHDKCLDALSLPKVPPKDGAKFIYLIPSFAALGWISPSTLAI